MTTQTCCNALAPGHTLMCKRRPSIVGGPEISGNQVIGKREPRGDEADRLKELAG